MAGLLLLAGGLALPAHAQSPATSADAAAGRMQRYDIPAGSLTPAVNQLAATAGVYLIGSGELTQGKTQAGLHGDYTVEQAFSALLAGTGLEAVATGNGQYALRQAPRLPVAADAALPAVVVTGTAMPGDLLPAYAGGQVARGGRLGLLGNLDVMDTPFNQTSYTSALIRDQQAQTLSDVLDNDPSVRRASPASGSAEYFRIRGFDVDTQSVAFNGLYALAPVYGGIPLEFAERVEVLKGPNALLNGMAPSGVVGGAVNIVPKRAGDEPLTRLTMGVGADTLWGTSLDLGRRFGQAGQWGIRVNGSYKNGATYIDGQTKKDDVEAIALDYRGERLRVALDAFRFDSRTRGGNSLFAGVGAPLTAIPHAPGGSTNLEPGTWFNEKTQGAILSGEFDLADAWTAFAKIGSAHFAQQGYFGIGAGDLQPNGDAVQFLGLDPLETRNVSGEAGIRGRFTTGFIDHALALSASGLKTTNSSAFSFLSRPVNIYAPTPILTWPDDPGAPIKNSETHLGSVAIADTLSMAHDRVLLTAGIRRQNVRSENFDTGGNVVSGYDKSAWTPMAGLVLRPYRFLSLYANTIQGLSAGSRVGDTYQNAGEVFPPYKSKQVEFGAKLETGRIINTLGVFQIRKPSTLIDYGTTPLPTLRLNGEQRNRGIEWTIAGELTPRLRVLGGVTYIDGRLTKTQDGAQDGNRAPGVAPWAVNIGAEWDVPGLPGVAVNGRAIHTSPQYATNENTLRLPSWTRIDVGARYATRVGGKPVTLRADIRNLTNRDYWAGVQGTSNLVLGIPRTFMVSATIDF